MNKKQTKKQKEIAAFIQTLIEMVENYKEYQDRLEALEEAMNEDRDGELFKI